MPKNKNITILDVITSFYFVIDLICDLSLPAHVLIDFISVRNLPDCSTSEFAVCVFSFSPEGPKPASRLLRPCCVSVCLSALQLNVVVFLFCFFLPMQNCHDRIDELFSVKIYIIGIVALAVAVVMVRTTL